MLDLRWAWLPSSDSPVGTLRECRKSLGISQAEMARRVGCSRLTIINLEKTFVGRVPTLLKMLAGLRICKPLQTNADDHNGLRATASRLFDATHQRCRVHWMRNALAHAPAKQFTAVAAMLKTIFAQDSKTDAEAQWDRQIGRVAAVVDTDEGTLRY
ncbi:hypothetical protein DT23_17595 [Thioclava indica]|uniref:HTH cro/C1-type domain-containing protein n=1 Tax=Thioclava indica TaxID=1353528 RepID=A0A074JJX2_9RHOB|nr:hypothetical protein DT23_17595 [Thioclava indica]